MSRQIATAKAINIASKKKSGVDSTTVKTANISELAINTNQVLAIFSAWIDCWGVAKW